ncbi:PBP1A family penicillin-binding protein [Bhargavaea cecembensis]|uniref:PBP1A family penicillin-binding protein n=1 Tax=Bhargavaea cecembensis TaxID=394098 RepID=UPI00058C27C6|nr:PBP1A family penicillin-binding protein [Bhargavaea cecembensis]
MSDHIPSRSERRKQQELEKKASRRRKQPAGRKTPGGKKKPVWKRIISAIVLLGVIFLVAGAALFTYYAASAPKLDAESLKDPLSSELYALGSDEPFMTLGSENREYVEYEDIPADMRDAILATEDVRFFKHHGIDFWRLGGAVLANLRDGFGAQGASTITQQVIKNSFLQNEKTLKRKAQEAWLAFQLERKYSKEEIFEMYFNKVLMSGNIYGMGTAADSFYGKEPAELTLPEMALLAGMPQSPNRYNPYNHPERAEKRRNIVLGLMVQHGKITQEQADGARAIPVTEGLVPPEQRKQHNSGKYAAFVDMVTAELEKHDLSISDGLKIYTTLDPAAQEKAEEVVSSGNLPSEQINAGVAVVDTKTGAIRAIGGGRDYVTGNFNYAIKNNRDVGSTIKPVLDYAPAIEYLDWSTGQTVKDEKTTYKGSKQVIRNANGKYLGKMTMRKALYMSQNVPAVKTFEEVGGGRAAEFAGNVGIKVDKPNSSNAIGGGVSASPLQMAGAYAAFGNGGMYTEPFSVEKVILRDGKTERTLKPKPVSAMKDSTAYMITDVLRDVVKNPQGTGYKYVKSGGLDVAGKTGTTNYDSKTIEKIGIGPEGFSVPDSWFVGYTPEYSIAVWTGHEKYNQPIQSWDERSYPQRAFSDILLDLAQRTDNTTFKKPKSVVEATIQVGTDPLRLAGAGTPSNKKSTELFVRGTEPKKAAKPAKEEPDETGLEAPTGLKADYDAEQNLVSLKWKHKAPDEDGDVQFNVSYSVDGGSAQALTTTSEKSAAATGIEPGRSYTFTVVAVLGDQTSAPASVSLQVGEKAEPDEEEPDEQEPPEDEEEPDEQENPGQDNPGDQNSGGEQGGNNGNGNNSGNNNGNNNGDNQGTPGNGQQNPGGGNNSGGNQGGQGGQGGSNQGGGQGGGNQGGSGGSGGGQGGGGNTGGSGNSGSPGQPPGGGDGE